MGLVAIAVTKAAFFPLPTINEGIMKMQELTPHPLGDPQFVPMHDVRFLMFGRRNLM